MTKSIFSKAILFLFAIGFLGVSGQEKKDYPEPDFEYKVYPYTEGSKELTELETGSLGEDDRTSGLTEEEHFFYANGEKANTRIKKSAKNNFLVKWYSSGGGGDIQKEYELYKFTYNKKKKRREFVTEKTSTYIRSDSKTNTKMFWKSKIVKTIMAADGRNLKFNVYLFSIENFEPGEYVWINGSTNYFFGIDE